MKRRDLLAGFAAAGVQLEAQHSAESLYIPKPHLVEDRKFLHDFMDEFSFVELVTAAPTIRITSHALPPLPESTSSTQIPVATTCPNALAENRLRDCGTR